MLFYCNQYTGVKLIPHLFSCFCDNPLDFYAFLSFSHFLIYAWAKSLCFGDIRKAPVSGASFLSLFRIRPRPSLAQPQVYDSASISRRVSLFHFLRLYFISSMYPPPDRGRIRGDVFNRISFVWIVNAFSFFFALIFIPPYFVLSLNMAIRNKWLKTVLCTMFFNH